MTSLRDELWSLSSQVRGRWNSPWAASFSKFRESSWILRASNLEALCKMTDHTILPTILIYTGSPRSHISGGHLYQVGNGRIWLPMHHTSLHMVRIAIIMYHFDRAITILWLIVYESSSSLLPSRVYCLAVYDRYKYMVGWEYEEIYISLDSTFKHCVSCRESQQYTILMRRRTERICPIIFALLPNEDEKTYQ